jgi:hypothetical protein
LDALAGTAGPFLTSSLHSIKFVNVRDPSN